MQFMYDRPYFVPEYLNFATTSKDLLPIFIIIIMSYIVLHGELRL
jgi:hypothetical protein